MKEDIPPFLFTQGLKSRLMLLKKKLSEKTELLKTMPEGRIMVAHNHGTPQFYCISKAGGKRRRYLSKKQPELIRALAQKRLLENALPDLKAEITCTERLVQHYARVASKPPCFPPELLSHTTPLTLPDEEYARLWQAVVHKKKQPDEHSTYITACGEQVRSKSEILIADALHRAGVPYHYECELKLPGLGKVHPDFLCLNSRTRRTYWWEHLGRMDDEQYLKNALIRIQAYIQAGIFPGEDLILTAETAEMQLDTRIVQQLIEHYLKWD